MATLLLLIILGFMAIVAIAGVVIFNRLVAQRLQVDNGWSQIDVQLNRRADLVPNLVETVKGYASHEKSTFEEVVAARNAGVSAQTPAEKAAADNILTGALSKLFALSEAYPDLKANQNFLQLQEELTSTEDRISYARQFYNDRVRIYNTSIQQFPAMIVAGLGKFEPREFFEVSDDAVREVPKVQF